MRKVAATALAVPVLALLYLPVLRRGKAIRAGIAIGAAVGIVAGVLAAGAVNPAGTTAGKPRPILPVPVAALRTDLETGLAPDAAIDIAFTSAMNADSVRAALSVEPHSALRVSWNPERTVLTVEPLARWATGTYYTVTVEAGALGLTGQPLVAPVRAAFLTRATTSATIAPTAVVGSAAPPRIRTDSGFTVDFSAQLDPTTVAGALTIDPPVAGSWTRPDASTGRYVFTPVGRLAADTIYTIALGDRLRDADGSRVASDPLVVRTATAPSVVRFRPASKATDVERAATLSIRFSEPMDPATTTRAFTATAAGKAIKGSVRWAERNTVLVFDPAANFGFDQEVTLEVAATATSANGVPIAKPAAATFTTLPKPAPALVSTTPTAGTSGGGSSGGGSTGGGSVGSGSWTAVEAYYLKLMNCTRTGGIVTSTGACSSPGGRNVAPLKLDAGISSKVARPYAKLLATRNQCTHFLGGNPGDRLRRAGYTSYIWAENLGCRSGNPYGAVLGSHLHFQAERSYNGGHYVNLMNAKYDRAGIGVWVYGGRVRLVVDFYHPR